MERTHPITQMPKEQRMTTKDNYEAGILIKNKANLVSEIKLKISKIKEERKDQYFNHEFAKAYDVYLAGFLSMVENQALPDFDDSDWSYSFHIEDSGCSICMEQAKLADDNRVILKAFYTIINVKPKLVTVKEYAKMYGYKQEEVLQMVTECKFRHAVKYGEMWYIPVFAKTMLADYVNSLFSWKEDINFFTGDEELENENIKSLLKECNEVRILKIAEDKFRVKFADTRRGGEVCLEMNDRDRMIIERALIANPLVKRVSASRVLPDDAN